MDLHPFCRCSIEMKEIDFLQIFILYALFISDKKLILRDRKEIRENQEKIALYGRKKRLMLKRKGKSVSFKEWGLAILKEMRPYARILDEALKTERFSQSLLEQEKKMRNPDLTPSAQLLRSLEKNHQDLYAFILEKAKKYKACKRKIC